jgi:hypothetical protein
MDRTRDPRAFSEFFTEQAENWFARNKTPEFTSTDEAIGMISAADGLVDIYLSQLAVDNSTYSDYLILEFGSAIGEAFKMLFLGEWQYSEPQGRWLIAFTSPQGSIYEINIFNKLQKRFDNGMEDSIQYFYDTFKKMYLDEASAAGYKA